MTPYDNFQGRWGEQRELDRLLQAYAVEKAKIEARRQGHNVLEFCARSEQSNKVLPGNGQPNDSGNNDPLAAIRALSALASADSSAILVLVNFQSFPTRGKVPDLRAG